MSIVDTWDWDKIKLAENSEEKIEMKCDICGHKFEAFEYFVARGFGDYSCEIFMCENCFFDIALNELNCKSMQMNHNGTDCYDPADNDGEEPWDKEYTYE